MLTQAEVLRPGSEVECGEFVLSKEDLSVFAASLYFDDRFEVALRWLVMSRQLRVIVDQVMSRFSSQGSPGLERVEWGVPTRFDEPLTVRRTILEARRSNSRADIMLIRIRFDTLNARGESVLSVTQWAMFRADVGTTPVVARTDGFPARYVRPTDGAPPLFREPDPWKQWRDPAIGMVARLGTYRFEADDIIAFARAFDPQPFHLDAAAARHSLFGQLCASGLQTAVIWGALSGSVPQASESPCLRNLRWIRPVYAGETIAYRSSVVAIAPDSQQRGFALLTRRNQGCDVDGHVVFEFEDEIGLPMGA